MRNKKKYTYVVRMPLSMRFSFRIALCNALASAGSTARHVREASSTIRYL